VNYGAETTFEFEVFNGKNHAVIAEVDVQGDVRTRSGPNPFSAEIKPKERVRLGVVTSLRDIQSSWKWQSTTLPTPQITPIVNRNEANGVFLTQTQIPNEVMNTLEFDAENTLGVDVIISIDLIGSAQIDLLGHTKPIQKKLRARSKASCGTIKFKGDLSVSWGWKEDR